MTTISAFSPLRFAPPRNFNSFKNPSRSYIQYLVFSESPIRISSSHVKRPILHWSKKVKAASVDIPIPEDEGQEAAQPAVSIPVSPSDTLTMFFQAEGTMSEDTVSRVTKALERSDGISQLKVKVTEGIGIVELKKQTTVQATGVASALVELIQGAGFKLQTLNLSFEDGENAALV